MTCPTATTFHRGATRPITSRSESRLAFHSIAENPRRRKSASPIAASVTLLLSLPVTAHADPPDATIGCTESSDLENTGEAVADDDCDPLPLVTFEDTKSDNGREAGVQHQSMDGS